MKMCIINDKKNKKKFINEENTVNEETNQKNVNEKKLYKREFYE